MSKKKKTTRIDNLQGIGINSIPPEEKYLMELKKKGLEAEYVCGVLAISSSWENYRSTPKRKSISNIVKESGYDKPFVIRMKREENAAN